MRILKRAAGAALTVWIVITISFAMVHFMPGDPLEHLVGQERYYELLYEAPEELDRIAEKYGLNDSLGEQYLSYMKSVLTLDFGTAYSNKKPVLDNVLNRAKWTLILSIPTFVVGGLLGAVLGLAAGWKKGGWLDRILTPVMLFLNTVPTNCIGILFLVAFAFKAGWFPVNGMTSGGLTGLAKVLDIAYHAALPLILLILFRTAANFLNMKSNVSQIRNEESITLAYAKGRSSQGVLRVHVVKNAMLPYVATLCVQLGNLLSGSMILEVIFGWKGMGQLFYSAVISSDYPTAQLCFLISAVCTVGGNLLGDVLLGWIDPRIREGLK